MASDRLFEMLAQAEGQPSHTLRAVESAGQAGNDILGGYMGGKEIQQKLEQYKLLSTPLGQMYSDPSQIPFGLSPQHTVKDLITLAPAMENYVPSNLIRGAAGAYGANVGGGSAPTPSPGASPNPTPPGTTALAGIEGTGAPPNLTMDIPAGGMGMKGFQNVVLPALKAGQEERHFGVSQGNENERARLSRDQAERNFQISQANEQGRARAGVAEKNVPNLTEVGQLETALTAMDKLNSDPSNMSIPFTGNIGAMYAANVPNTQSKWALNQKAAEGWANVGAGAIEKLVEGRYNDDQMRRIKESLFPTGNELGTRAGNIKIQQLRSYVQKAKTGAISQVLSSLDAIAGGSPNLTGLTNPEENILTPSELQGHQAAIKWARANPNDPRARAVLAKASALSGGH